MHPMTYRCPDCGRRFWAIVFLSPAFWRYAITGRLCRCGHTPDALADV